MGEPLPANKEQIATLQFLINPISCIEASGSLSASFSSVRVRSVERLGRSCMLEGANTSARGRRQGQGGGHDQWTGPQSPFEPKATDPTLSPLLAAIKGDKQETALPTCCFGPGALMFLRGCS